MLVGLIKGKLRRRTMLPWRQSLTELCLFVGGFSVAASWTVCQIVLAIILTCPDHSLTFRVLEDQNPNPLLPGGQREVGQKSRLDLQDRVWTPQPAWTVPAGQ